jgi:mRNA interferase RelE/StbE
MAYKILVERNAEKEFKKIPKEIQKKIVLIITKLKDNSRPINARKISDSENYYRIRIGDYRILYEINDKEKELNIFRIRHRKEAYLNL